MDNTIDNQNLAQQNDSNAPEQPQQTAEAQKPVEAQQPQTSYAVRPEHRHHRRLEYADKSNMLVIRNWLNIGFMLFAIVGVILWTQMDDHTIANIMLIIGVVMKIAEVCIRLFKK